MSNAFQLPADNWLPLSPFGEFPHRESGTVQVLDEQAARKMKTAFAEESVRKPNFAGLLLDFDHFSYDPDKSSGAAGWIKDLDWDPSGLKIQVKWTDSGLKAVQAGDYRFLSPVWMPSDVEPLGNRRIRPLRLDSVGLTNAPNIKGSRPISNRTQLAEAPIDPARALRQFNAIVNRCKQELGLSFTDAWEAAKAEAPHLIQAAQVPLVNDNRGGIRGFAEYEWKSVSTGDPVRDLEGSLSELEDLRIEAFLERLKKLQKELGSYAYAWGQIQRYEPALLNRAGAYERFTREKAENGETWALDQEIEAFVDLLERFFYKSRSWSQAWLDARGKYSFSFLKPAFSFPLTPAQKAQWDKAHADWNEAASKAPSKKDWPKLEEYWPKNPPGA